MKGKIQDTVEDNIQGEMQEDIKLESLVVNPTWREVLVDLVANEQIDPWNLDIVDITHKYIESVKKMKVLDLHIPSNVILAAAILLRFKSEMLRLETEEQVAESEVFIDDQRLVEVPMLHLRLRVPPERNITLTDLITAMEEVMQIEKNRIEREKKRKETSVMELKIPEYDIEKEMEEVLKKANKLADSMGWLLFSKLLKDETPRTVVLTLLPLLHLAQEEKLEISQKKMFGEIKIKVNSSNAN